MVILGISIGTRTSGLAIISNAGLVEWRTLSFKNSWSEQKADYIVRTYERYVRQHKVTVVAVKIPPSSHFTEALTSLLEKLVKAFTCYGCMIEYTSKQELKHTLPEVKNTRQLMRYTASLYPSIASTVQKELVNRNKYHHRMIEAVVVAHHAKQKHNPPPD